MAIADQLFGVDQDVIYEHLSRSYRDVELGLDVHTKLCLGAYCFAHFNYDEGRRGTRWLCHRQLASLYATDCARLWRRRSLRECIER